jgi:hypothetical protein
MYYDLPVGGWLSDPKLEMIKPRTRTSEPLVLVVIRRYVAGC